MDDEACPVCFTELRRTIEARPPCAHSICLRCLLQLHRRECVLCREPLGGHFLVEPVAIDFGFPPIAVPTIDVPEDVFGGDVAAAFSP